MKYLLIAAALAAVACANHHGDHSMKSKMMTNSSFDIRASFDMADTDKDNAIQKSEFDALYASFDDNKDGIVDGEEFVKHFSKTGLSYDGSLYLFFRTDQNSDNNITSSEIANTFASFDENNDMEVSYDEYAALMAKLFDELRIAQEASPKLEAAVDKADADKDGKLTRDEFWSILSPADTDGDGLVSQAEFKVFWMAAMNEPEDRTNALFRMYDGDMDGFFGTDDDKRRMFDGYDYNKDGFVSKQEFMNAMLWSFAYIMKGMDVPMSKMMDLDKGFSMADTNKDGVIKMDEFAAVYKKLDDNMDGVINGSEYVMHGMKKGLTQYGATFMFFVTDMNEDSGIDKMEIEKMFKKSDRNMNGEISKEEHKMVSHMFMYYVTKVDKGMPKIKAMAAKADANKDMKLTIDEMWSTVSDSGVNETDFVRYWMSATDASEDASKRLFHIMDTDKDNLLKKKTDGVHLYKEFDYNKDGVVSIEEFANSMLFLFTKVVREQKKDLKMRMYSKFNATANFDFADTNMDGMIQKSEHAAAYVKIDKDMNKEISYTEFIPAEMAAGFSRSGALYIFFRMDSNDDNKLEQSEIDNSFTSVDTNDDMAVSMDEYKTAIKALKHQMGEASFAGHMLEKMFAKADADKDGNLTSTEMLTMFDDADKDKDGLVSQTEFKPFWMMKTMEPSDRTNLLFGYLDTNNDGFFGDGDEKKTLFDSFDYNDDNKVTKQEFMDAMLWLFARIMDDLEMAMKSKDVIGYFF